MKKLIPNYLKRYVKLTFRNIGQSFMYYLVEKRMLFPEKERFSRVVFVCKGNVCRSVFAEARFRRIAGSRMKLAESCGIEVNQGGCPPQKAIEISAEYGCDLAAKRAKPLGQCDLKNADLILAMEYRQYKKLAAMFPEKKNCIRLLREYAPFPFFLFCNIDDPYGWGEREFKKIFKLIDKSLEGLFPFSSSTQKKSCG